MRPTPRRSPACCLVARASRRTLPGGVEIAEPGGDARPRRPAPPRRSSRLPACGAAKKASSWRRRAPVSSPCASSTVPRLSSAIASSAGSPSAWLRASARSQRCRAPARSPCATSTAAAVLSVRVSITRSPIRTYQSMDWSRFLSASASSPRSWCSAAQAEVLRRDADAAADLLGDGERLAGWPSRRRRGRPGPARAPPTFASAWPYPHDSRPSWPAPRTPGTGGPPPAALAHP